MTDTIFYSWQADTQEKDCRYFIEQALKKAIEDLAEDVSIDPAIREGLEMDKDTLGVAGTPPIVDTIFRKIDVAGAFLADLTFVGDRRDSRPTPNPNVLLEYGWALRSRGYSRIICVMNTAYGEPSDATLPFNMKHLRWPIQYNLPEGADGATKAAIKSDLAGKLKSALRAIVQSGDFRTAPPPPPEPPNFQPRDPLDGHARFRKHGEPIGIIDSRFGVPDVGSNVVLADGPALWLRVMPAMQLGRDWSVSQLRDTMSRAGLALLPLGWGHSSWSFVRGYDGFGYFPHASNTMEAVPAISFAFKSGEIWTVYVGPISTTQAETFMNVERMFTECLIRCVHFMRDGLGIALPYRWNAGIEGIKGKRMQRIARPGHYFTDQLSGPSLRDLIVETGLLREGEKTQLALKPFFLEIYDACGEERLPHMDQALENLQM